MGVFVNERNFRVVQKTYQAMNEGMESLRENKKKTIWLLKANENNDNEQF